MPLSLAPARIDDLVVRRFGDDVQLQFTVPAKNTDGSTPADLTAVDVFGLTGDLVDESGGPLGDAAFASTASLVRTLAIEPPPEKAPEEGGRQPAQAARKGLAQGDRVTVVERLSPDVRAITPRPSAAPGRARELRTPPAGDEPPIGPSLSPEERVLERHYAVAGRSRRGVMGPLSRRVAVPLGPLPPAPDAPRVTYDEQQLTVSWPEPAGIRRPVQAPAPEGLLKARALVAGPAAHTYNVYAISGAASGAPGPLTPANASPLSEPHLDVREVKFGEEHCFLVRTVEQHGQATVESEPSPVACVTPRDTFPPAPPRNLAAVGAEGAINLIWEASDAADLAGYLVLRGEAGGPLRVVTSEPVRETTFRDAAVRTGTRYVYAVVAVDTAQPPNRSSESNRVEETAR
jgi:hypothetical protein